MRLGSFGALIALLAALLLMTSTARAATGAEELTTFGSEGRAAGQVSLPWGMAVDPVTGHLYVGGVAGNDRIEEFTPWGEFVKAFGWGVAAGAVDEEQEVRIRAAAGQFQLAYGASETADLSFDASAAEVEAALDALPSISAAGGSVGVREAVGSTDGSTPYIYVVTFEGSLAGTDVPQLTITSGTTPASGGTPSTTLEVNTRADGTSGGTGLESCTTTSECRAGTSGPGAGQIGSVFGLAIDSSGDLYVQESTGEGKNANVRVQKFSPDGHFLLMFGGEVDKSQVTKREEQEAKAEPVTVTHEMEDICTAASGDECGAGTEGAAEGQFAEGAGGGIAVSGNGTIYVGDSERIQVFSLDGVYESEIKLPGDELRTLALDPTSGDIYITVRNGENVTRLSPSGVPLGDIEIRYPWALATDSSGDVYAVSREYQISSTDVIPEAVLEFNAAGKQIASLPPELLPGTSGQHYILYGLATSTLGDVYIANDSPPYAKSLISLFGPAPVEFESPPEVPPTITAEYASSVGSTDATLKAQINPHFWTDATYYVEYGTEPCETSVCAVQPASPGSRLTSKVAASNVTSPGILLEGLEPATTYYYRFVTQSGGGGPVFGPGHAFRTFPEAAGSEAGCVNEAFRTGPGAMLPDCRAYELVSPVDKDNGDITALFDLTGYQTGLFQSAVSGEALTYTSYRAFGNAKSAPWVSQYLAVRNPATGWSTEAISPPQGEKANVGANFTESFENAYKYFSSDLSSGWLQLNTDPPLAGGGLQNALNLYRRDNASGSYETVTTVEPSFANPAFSGPYGSEPELQGVAADGSHAVYRIDAALTSDASTGMYRVYETGGAELKPICVLPNGTPSPDSCSAGTAVTEVWNPAANRVNSVAHAVSADGSEVYWTDAAGGASHGLGSLYLRENAEQEQSALSGSTCTEPERACTLAVSQAGLNARFWDASTDGLKALYAIEEDQASPLNGNLYLFDADGEGSPRQLIAKDTEGVLGASEDLSYIYFISGEVIPGTSGATAKAPNLYLYHEGAYTFIAQVESEVVGIFGTDDASPEPVFHVGRVTPDGLHIAFMASNSITGYDNRDALSGEPDAEVYTYEVGAEGPICVSCNPSGARPVGEEVEEKGAWVAAAIPGWQTQLYASRVLSDEGTRLFFDSYDALTPRDTNGKEDVYEWEAAGAGDCTSANPSYSSVSGGCVSLISTGESAYASVFLDADPSGNNAFFTTETSLVPQDAGLMDVYDARFDGGLPAPAGPVAGCEGEACQSPPNPPIAVTPGSLTFSGPGDPTRIVVTSGKPRQLTRAQKLAKALAACRAKSKGNRAKCRARARRKYGKAKRAGKSRRGANKRVGKSRKGAK